MGLKRRPRRLLEEKPPTIAGYVVAWTALTPEQAVDFYLTLPPELRQPRVKVGHENYERQVRLEER